MHVTTFYSFKGGVGRSLALANVAQELSSAGERVLIVDFDLEAPGVDTIFGSARANTAGGIVEFVRSYETGDAPPDVRDFVYEVSDIETEGPPVLVMPAGLQDPTYARRLSEIDWVDLYERQEGFLLFEDLKAQWEQHLEVDYVLVDSRTGHTDVTGICTRQLPDTVVIVFFPNEQNLRGLRKVVSDIREEPEFSNRDPIELIFVASDVPRLDDEEAILSRRMKAFSNQLDIRDRIHTVHHYDSLDLLERPLFTRDRPKSRLAREYVELTRRVRMSNVEDRQGVLWQLKEPSFWRGRFTSEHLFERLSQIEASHRTDGEILFQIGVLRSRFGQVAEAKSLFEEALETGFMKPEAHLALADAFQRLGKPAEAGRAARRVFSDSTTTIDTLQRAVELLRLSSAEELVGIVDSPAVNSLPLESRVDLAALLDRNVSEARIAVQLLLPLVKRARGTEDWLRYARFQLGLMSVAIGEWDRAEEQFRMILRKDPEDLSCLFNLAIAVWGRTGVPERALFAQVLDIAPTTAMGRVPNFLQCMAVSEYVIGNEDAARGRLEESRSAIQQRYGPQFSCWRFLSVPPHIFLQDLDEIQEWMDGAGVQPRFLDAGGQEELPLA